MKVKNLSDRRIGVWIIITLIVALYFSTLIKNHSEDTEDSLWYMHIVSYHDITYQFNPHNLFYCIINYSFYNFWRFCGYSGNAEIPMESLNIIFGASVLLGVYFFTTKLNFPRLLILFCISATAFSYIFWKSSVDCGARVLPIVFILLSFHRLTLIQKQPLSFKNHLLLGIFNAAAILTYQQHILLTLVILFGYGYIFIKAKNINGTRSFKFLNCISLYLITCLFLVFFSYILVAVFIQGFTKYSDILKWSMMYIDMQKWDWKILVIPKTVVEFFRAFIGGHFVYSFPWVQKSLLRIHPEYLFSEEIYLVADFSILKRFILAASTVVFLFTLIFINLYLIKHKVLKLLRCCVYDETLHFFLFISCAYLAAVILSAMALRSQGVRLFVSLVPFAVMVFALLIIPVINKLIIRVTIPIIIVTLMIINCYGSILPQTNHKQDYWYKFNSWLINNCKAGDLVISGSGYIPDCYVRFYSKGADVFSPFIDISLKDLDYRFRNSVALLKPRRILFSSTVYSPDKRFILTEMIEKSYIQKMKDFFLENSKYLTLIHSDQWQEIFVFNENEYFRNRNIYNAAIGQGNKKVKK